MGLFDLFWSDHLAEHVWVTGSSDFSGPALVDSADYSHFALPTDPTKACSSYDSDNLVREDDCVLTGPRHILCEVGKQSLQYVPH